MPSPSFPPHDRHYDLILFGATGFTGSLIAQYIAKRYGISSSSHNSPNSLRWAVAGRNPVKLAVLKRELESAFPSPNASLDTLIADSHNLDELRQLAKQTKVILTTVGPYMHFGAPLLQACLDEETDYVDLCGELPFVLQSINDAHAIAQANGTRIVHAAGFDALPSDLGVLAVQSVLFDVGEEPARSVLGILSSPISRISTGTANSIASLFDWAAQSEDHLDLLEDPFSLNLDRGFLVGQHDPSIPWFDPTTTSWISPWLMGRFNTRIVRRSNELDGFPYGRRFSYQEGILAEAPVVRSEFMRDRVSHKTIHLADALYASLSTLRSALLIRTFQRPKLRNFLFNLAAYALDASSSKTDDGQLHMIFSARNGEYEVARTTLRCSKDPAYAGTAIMSAETAIALAHDRHYLPNNAGVLTPASAIGRRLVARLEETGTFSFETTLL